ncbi:MAG: DUF6766 family protein [bacterium]
MWRANGLSIVLAALFLACLAGHSIAGWRFNNAALVQHGRHALTYGEFLHSGEFLESVAENWESEFLQMAFYVVLTVFLRQKGSSESKRLDGREEVDEDPENHRKDRKAPGPVRAGGWRLALYKNSLSLAFVVLFLTSFIAHAAGGARAFNEEHSEHGSAERVSWVGYMGTSRFWYESFQNWQSEFLAVLSIVTLSIVLRQYKSPESKPVHAPHDSTGND